MTGRAMGTISIEPAFAGVGESLASLAAFAGAERTTLGRVSPAKLAKPLHRAVETVAGMDG